MGTEQAFAVAFGLVFLVLVGLYFLARSSSENADAPQPIWWRAVRGGVTIVMVTFLICGGTVVLLNGAPNYFLSAGVAAFCYGLAITVSSGRKFKPSILRIRWLASAMMFSLWAIGAAVEGGPVAMLGAILSLMVATFWWWLVFKIHWSER